MLLAGGLTKPLKQRLAQELGLDYGVVANWFSARNIKANREVATLGFEPTPDAALADAETAAPALAADPLKGTALAPDPVAEPTHGVAEASVGAEEASGAAVQHAVLDAVHGVVGGPPDVPDQPAARRGWLTSQRFKQASGKRGPAVLLVLDVGAFTLPCLVRNDVCRSVPARRATGFRTL